MAEGSSTNAVNDSAKRHSRGIWWWVSKLTIGAGVGWVVFILSRDFSSLRDNFRIASGFWLAYTLLAGSAALLFTVPIFRLLLRYYGDFPISYLYAARLLFVAQMLRHLPGRIWGIVYLVKEMKPSVPPVAMIRANLDIMLYSLTFNLLVSGMLVLGVLVSAAAGVAFAIASLILVVIAIRLDWIGGFIRVVVRLIPRISKNYSETLIPRGTLPWTSAFAITLYYVLLWCLYLSVWWALSHVFPVLAETNIWLLCAAYSTAWVAGFITMITPGGIGIREAGFIALSANLATLPNLTYLAVFIRLWQILIEFMLFIAFAFVKPDTKVDELATDRDQQ